MSNITADRSIPTSADQLGSPPWGGHHQGQQTDTLPPLPVPSWRTATWHMTMIKWLRVKALSDLPPPFTSEKEPLHTVDTWSNSSVGHYQQGPHKDTDVSEGAGGMDRLQFRWKPSASQISSATFIIMSLFLYWGGFKCCCCTQLSFYGTNAGILQRLLYANPLRLK